MRIDNIQTNRIPQCLGYDRVSTINQRDNGLSLETQKTQILKKIEELGGVLAEEIYEDGGITGTSIEKRPAIQALIARCAKGDIDYIIVQDSSRISRNTLEYLVIKQTLKKYGTTVIPLTGAISADIGPMGDVMDEMIAVVHSIVPRLTSYKVKQTAAEKFKAGYYPSVAIVGYMNVVNKNPTGSYDRRIIVPNPEVAPFITQAFKMYATGNHSIFSIREYLHNNGVRGKTGRPLAYSLMHKILQNPFYWGWMKYGGMEALGKHEPLIDKKTFDIVQYTLKRRGDSGIRQRKHNFLLRGVVFCNLCGKRYTAEWHVNEKKFASRGGRIGYYHCSGIGRVHKCPTSYVEIDDLETQAEQEVTKLEFTQEFIEAVKRNVRKVYENTNDRVKLSKKAAYNRRDALEIKRERLEEELLEGTISRDRFTVLNAKIDAEMLEVQRELADINKIRTIDVKIVDDVLALTRDIATTYKEADTNAKRAYLNFFFEKILVENKKVVNVQYQPVIDVLNKAKLGILTTNGLPDVDSNHEP
ncbi:MAG TPA: recombinase family protein [Candidatus Woesebacteria bacterium]|nr:recombinase family protein [Candidatus Woesebacteria bacterium]